MIKDVPSVQTHSYAEVAQFIEYATYEKHGADDFLVNYQTHRHAHRHARTCMKKNKPICRFNFSIPPMPYIVVLAPQDDVDEEFSTAALTYQKIVDYLNLTKFRETEVEMTFQDFLFELQINVECYIIIETRKGFPEAKSTRSKNKCIQYRSNKELASKYGYSVQFGCICMCFLYSVLHI